MPLVFLQGLEHAAHPVFPGRVSSPSSFGTELGYNHWQFLGRTLHFGNPLIDRVTLERVGMAGVDDAVSVRVGRSLPGFLGWLETGAGELAGDLLGELLPAAMAITGAGFVLTAVGITMRTVKKRHTH